MLSISIDIFAILKYTYSISLLLKGSDLANAISGTRFGYPPSCQRALSPPRNGWGLGSSGRPPVNSLQKQEGAAETAVGERVWKFLMDVRFRGASRQRLVLYRKL